MIKISLLCRETDVTNFVNSLDDMSKLFKCFNPTLGEFFERSCFIQTKVCQEIQNLNWARTHENDIKVLEGNFTLVNEDILNEKLEQEVDGHIFGKFAKLIFSKQEASKSLVEVKILRTNWVFK